MNVDCLYLRSVKLYAMHTNKFVKTYARFCFAFLLPAILHFVLFLLFENGIEKFISFFRVVQTFLS